MGERLLLEGVDLPELMEYVRSEFGPGAKIVRAERVRQGGFAGFFAKEKYELTVEVPPRPSARPVPPLRSRRPPPPRASSMEDLLAAADAADAVPQVVPNPAPPAPVEVVPPPSPDRAREEIVASPGAAARAATPRAATGGSQFATVLDQVRALAAEGLPPEALTAPAGEVVPEDVATTVDDVATVPKPEPAESQPVDGGRSEPTGAAWAQDVLARAAERAKERAALAAPVPTTPALTPSADQPVSPPTDAAAAADPLVGTPLRSALTHLGVPDALLATVPLTLTAVLDEIPSAPSMPRGPGEVLALVGAAADLVGLEPLLVERMRLAPSDVVHAGTGLRFDPSATGLDRPTRVSSVASLSAWRSRAPMARHAWLLLIPADGGPDARAEAAEMAFAARPTQLWAVVDARLKPRDAARWLDQVGSRHPVDALAVRALADTSAPGTVLGLGPPVAWLDGLPTSRVVWAAALGQPLDAALSQ